MHHHSRVVGWLSAIPSISFTRADYAVRTCVRLQGEEALRSWGLVLKSLGAELPEPRGWLIDRYLKGHEAGLMNECVRQGDVEGAVKAYYGRRSQKAQEEPRGPFPITEQQSLWLRGLLPPMPEPRAWDYWSLQRIA